MDINKELKQSKWNGHPDFARIAKTAVLLYRSGHSMSDIMSHLDNEFKPKMGMKEESVPCSIFGELGSMIDEKSHDQLQTASKLPVAMQSALMPDAHLGYALPIGGVIGLDNAISPHFIGFDIACRMSISIVDINPSDLESNKEYYAKILNDNTSFGLGADYTKLRSGKQDHIVMDSPLWDETEITKMLKDVAHNQLGSSGGGNHFANLMIGEITQENDTIPDHLSVGDSFVALVTHSGSRKVGHKLATHYSNLAKAWTEANAIGIPNGYEWLPLDHSLGEEYWNVMHLMGRYAQANHELIHDNFIRDVGCQRIFYGENHHNFAWKENINGKDMVVHRKGATPAGVGVFGVVPGSMGTRTYLVEGLGNPDSLNSSSHGAGRLHSRTKAKQQHNEVSYKKLIKNADILAIGVSKDETNQCYKDIDDVMKYQEGSLVRSIGSLFPRVVIMGGDQKSDDGD